MVAPVVTYKDLDPLIKRLDQRNVIERIFGQEEFDQLKKQAYDEDGIAYPGILNQKLKPVFDTYMKNMDEKINSSSGEEKQNLEQERDSVKKLYESVSSQLETDMTKSPAELIKNALSSLRDLVMGKATAVKTNTEGDQDNPNVLKRTLHQDGVEVTEQHGRISARSNTASDFLAQNPIFNGLFKLAGLSPIPLVPQPKKPEDALVEHYEALGKDKNEPVEIEGLNQKNLKALEEKRARFIEEALHEKDFGKCIANIFKALFTIDSERKSLEKAAEAFNRKGYNVKNLNFLAETKHEGAAEKLFHTFEKQFGEGDFNLVKPFWTLLQDFFKGPGEDSSTYAQKLTDEYEEGIQKRGKLESQEKAAKEEQQPAEPAVEAGQRQNQNETPEEKIEREKLEKEQQDKLKSGKSEPASANQNEGVTISGNQSSQKSQNPDIDTSTSSTPSMGPSNQ